MEINEFTKQMIVFYAGLFAAKNDGLDKQDSVEQAIKLAEIVVEAIAKREKDKFVEKAQ